MKKVNNFKELVKHIRREILTDGFNELQIQFWDDTVFFSIYETFNVTIVISKEKVYSMDFKEYEEKYTVKLKSEFLNGDLTVSELKEISEICCFLEENIDIVTSMIN